MHRCLRIGVCSSEPRSHTRGGHPIVPWHNETGAVCREGKKSFAPVMRARLDKLGINKTDPDELTEEERSRCSCVGNDLGAF